MNIPLLQASFGAALCVLLAGNAFASETDQYLAWEVELEDSTELINDYLNEHAAIYLERANRRKKPIATAQEVTRQFYLYLFEGLHYSRLRRWLQNSDEIERFPDASTSFFAYQRKSIYRGMAFPYVLPMARTIRVGKVYLGIDKIGHFFGFGRRYFQRYIRFREEGLEEDEALQRTIRVGINKEMSIVGMLVDGVFSHGDLEANFQGMQMARDLGEGDDAQIQRQGKTWVLVRPIHIENYITPDFDESFNNSHYWALRKKKTLQLLKTRYAGKDLPDTVIQRFEGYRQIPPSLSKQIITQFFEDRGTNYQKEQSLDTLSEGL